MMRRDSRSRSRSFGGGRSRSRSRSYSPRRRGGGGGGGGGRRGQNADEIAAARRAEQEEVRNLGRQGLRDLLTSTLESLYKDRIKPFANYIKGRFREREAPAALLRSFVEYYGEHADLFRVTQEPGGETAIFLEKDPEWFKGWVDLDAPEDPYEEATWDAFKEYLREGHTFAGGRYGMARELLKQQLAFLAPYTLGQVCHMVQLAIAHRRILVYHKKMLKPVVSEQGIRCTLGVSSDKDSEKDEIKTLGELCVVLFKALRRHTNGIRFDRMKQVIKEEGNVRLNEMVFQCTKLTELFRLEPLNIAFKMEPEGTVIHLRLGDEKQFTDEILRARDQSTNGEGGGERGYGAGWRDGSCDSGNYVTQRGPSD